LKIELEIVEKIYYNVGTIVIKWVKVERRNIPAFWIFHEVELMFLGQFKHTIDEKGRMTIPARFRNLLADGAFITRGFDQNLIVLSRSDFEKLSQHVHSLSLTKPDVRDLIRLLFAHAVMAEFDKSGRILIPQFLRNSAQLDGAVVVVGFGKFFEIWSHKLWTEKEVQFENAALTAKKFEMFDLPLE